MQRAWRVRFALVILVKTCDCVALCILTLYTREFFSSLASFTRFDYLIVAASRPGNAAFSSSLAGMT